MNSIQTSYEHIVLDEIGTPLIAGTTMKVVELVVEKLAYGWSAEELCFQHPYLSLGQIYSSLAYYADHQTEFEKDIEKRLELSIKLGKDIGTTPLLTRLRTKGFIT
ncbi:MAG: DUF433 domain-containing protein [Candidatus Brocadiaceae bacterium]|nr:DUF433 domain-containing protein [Candidatus Brocadiaceae bacterium]